MSMPRIVSARRPLAGPVLACILMLAPASGSAQPSEPPNTTKIIREVTYATRDAAFGGSNVVMRYGNWLGPGWWGGNEKDDRPGMLAPIDDLDRTAQRHDFGYQIAAELGRGRPGVEGTYRMIADIIAIRDTMMLDRDPAKWAHPPKDVALARTFVQRLVISFDYVWKRVNELKSKELGRDDITDLETLNRMLDGLPDVAKFEAEQRKRVRQWEADYAAFQARKAAVTPKPAPTAAPRPSADCSQGSLLDRSLCSHDPTKNAPRNR